MNKAEFIDAVATKAGLSKKDAKGAVDAVLDTIKNRSFEKNLAARVKLPYTEWWYKQENSTFLLEEAK